jgi:hypothetical protein
MACFTEPTHGLLHGHMEFLHQLSTSLRKAMNKGLVKRGTMQLITGNLYFSLKCYISKFDRALTRQGTYWVQVYSFTVSWRTHIKSFPKFAFCRQHSHTSTPYDNTDNTDNTETFQWNAETKLKQNKWAGYNFHISGEPWLATDDKNGFNNL